MGTEGPRSGPSEDPRTRRASCPAGMPTSTEQQRGPSGVETGKPGRKTGKGQGFRWQSYYHRKTGGRGRTQPRSSALAFRSCGTGGGVSWPSRGRSAGLGGGGRLCPSGTAHGRLVFSQKLGNSPHSDPSLDPADQWLVLHDLGPLRAWGPRGVAAIRSSPALCARACSSEQICWKKDPDAHRKRLGFPKVAEPCPFRPPGLDDKEAQSARRQGVSLHPEGCRQGRQKTVPKHTQRGHRCVTAGRCREAGLPPRLHPVSGLCPVCRGEGPEPPATQSVHRSQVKRV